GGCLGRLRILQSFFGRQARRSRVWIPRPRTPILRVLALPVDGTVDTTEAGDPPIRNLFRSIPVQALDELELHLNDLAGGNISPANAKRVENLLVRSWSAL